MKRRSFIKGLLAAAAVGLIVSTGPATRAELPQPVEKPQESYLDSEIDSGYVHAPYIFAPYVPLITTPVVVLDDFSARRGIVERYGQKLLNPSLYEQKLLVNRPWWKRLLGIR